MAKLLSRDEILAAEDLPREEVEVPEWGGAVLVRGLTGSERDSFEASIVESRGNDTRVNLVNLRAKLVTASVVDEAGARLFSDADVTALGKKSALALIRVFEVAQKLSGLTSTDVSDLAKKSENGQSGDSGSS